MLLDENYKEIMIIVFLECKLKGKWATAVTPVIPIINSKNHRVDELQRAMDENCSVELIVLDGLRRILQFRQGDMIDIESNVLIYNNKNIEEITVDEKEQLGKGKTRDILH